MWPPNPAQIAPGTRLRSIPRQVPITIATGSADRHARLLEVRALHEQVADHARLIIFDGAEHVDLDDYDPGLYSETLMKVVLGGNRGTAIGRQREPPLAGDGKSAHNGVKRDVSSYCEIEP